MKFNVGDKVYNKERGVGEIKKIDPKNKEFKFLVFFRKEKCLAWLPIEALRRAKDPQ